jgi:hypothetical protein
MLELGLDKKSAHNLERGSLMKSPFPGMDPYIEACGLGEDFHDKLVGEIERHLAEIIPEPILDKAA